MKHFVRSGAFGDVLWCEPILRHFLEKGEKVNIMTDFPEAFQNYPNSNLIVNQRVRKTYHRIDFFRSVIGLEKNVIDLNGAYEIDPLCHIVEAYAKKSGITNFKASYPRLFLSKEEKEDKIGKPYAVIHIEKHALNFRNIYGMQWRDIILYLNSLGMEVIQLSKFKTDIVGRWVETSGFREVMSYISNAKIFIGVDSGPSHIAAAFGIPSLLFFGAVNPQFRHLNSDKKVFMQQSCIYSGCYHKVISEKGQVCKIVGKNGEPPCAIHSTESVIIELEHLYSTL